MTHHTLKVRYREATKSPDAASATPITFLSEKRTPLLIPSAQVIYRHPAFP